VNTDKVIMMVRADTSDDLAAVGVLLDRIGTGGLGKRHRGFDVLQPRDRTGRWSGGHGGGGHRSRGDHHAEDVSEEGSPARRGQRRSRAMRVAVPAVAAAAGAAASRYLLGVRRKQQQRAADQRRPRTYPPPMSTTDAVAQALMHATLAYVDPTDKHR